MKYLLLLLVVAIGIWMLTAKSRRARRDGGGGSGAGRKSAPPQAMLSCAHCGVHLPASDALAEGSRVYCSEAHRRLGPGDGAP